MLIDLYVVFILIYVISIFLIVLTFITQIPRAEQLPTKICHKCAYELNQCSSFVQKYIKAKKKQKPNFRKRCCGLCYEPQKNEFTFDLSKEKKLQYNPFHKIQEIFNNEV